MAAPEGAYSGSGRTFEEAFDAAAKQALRHWKPRGPDDMTSVELVSMGALYGGFVGHTGTRSVTVRLHSARESAPGDGAAIMGAAPTSHGLRLLLVAKPESIFVNMMPPVRRPQRTSVALLLQVHNASSSVYEGSAPTSTLASFEVSVGGTAAWSFPEVDNPVVTPIRLAPGESRVFPAVWDVRDAVELVGADIVAMARFVPTDQVATVQIPVEVAH